MACVPVSIPHLRRSDTSCNLQCLQKTRPIEIHIRWSFRPCALCKLALRCQLRLRTNLMGVGQSSASGDSLDTKLLRDQRQDDCLQFYKHGDGSYERKFHQLHDNPLREGLVWRVCRRVSSLFTRLYNWDVPLYDFCRLHDLIDHYFPRHLLSHDQERFIGQDKSLGVVKSCK